MVEIPLQRTRATFDEVVWTPASEDGHEFLNLPGTILLIRNLHPSLAATPRFAQQQEGEHHEQHMGYFPKGAQTYTVPANEPMQMKAVTVNRAEANRGRDETVLIENDYDAEVLARVSFAAVKRGV